jgi:hypothetical protein
MRLPPPRQLSRGRGARRPASSSSRRLTRPRRTSLPRLRLSGRPPRGQAGRGRSRPQRRRARRILQIEAVDGPLRELGGRVGEISAHPSPSAAPPRLRRRWATSWRGTRGRRRADQASVAGRRNARALRRQSRRHAAVIGAHRAVVLLADPEPRPSSARCQPQPGRAVSAFCPTRSAGPADQGEADAPGDRRRTRPARRWTRPRAARRCGTKWRAASRGRPAGRAGVRARAPRPASRRDLDLLDRVEHLLDGELAVCAGSRPGRGRDGLARLVGESARVFVAASSERAASRPGEASTGAWRLQSRHFRCVRIRGPDRSGNDAAGSPGLRELVSRRGDVRSRTGERDLRSRRTRRHSRRSAHLPGGTGSRSSARRRSRAGRFRPLHPRADHWNTDGRGGRPPRLPPRRPRAPARYAGRGSKATPTSDPSGCPGSRDAGRGRRPRLMGAGALAFRSRGWDRGAAARDEAGPPDDAVDSSLRPSRAPMSSCSPCRVAVGPRAGRDAPRFSRRRVLEAPAIDRGGFPGVRYVASIHGGGDGVERAAAPTLRRPAWLLVRTARSSEVARRGCTRPGIGASRSSARTSATRRYVDQPPAARRRGSVARRRP